MKQEIRIALIIALVFTSSAAFAEGPVSKSALRVDFNKMIEDNNNQRKNLHQDLDVRAEERTIQPQAVVKEDDKSKVIDFIDVEVGVGQAPSIVDRRYDSVGDARLVNPKTILIEN